MATIYVPGPTVVKIGSNVLGYSDNDNLPAIQFTDHQREIKTVLSGDVPEEVVLQGTSARISVALVKWDQTVYNNMLATLRGGSSTTPTVGARVVYNEASVVLNIASVGQSMAYQFPVAYFQPDSAGDTQWGNRERVLTLAFSAIPDSGGQLFTYTP